MNARDLDKVLDTTKDDIAAEARSMLGDLRASDLTIRELIALHTLLRPAWERLRKPAPVYKLELVRGPQPDTG